MDSKNLKVLNLRNTLYLNVFSFVFLSFCPSSKKIPERALPSQTLAQCMFLGGGDGFAGPSSKKLPLVKATLPHLADHLQGRLSSRWRRLGRQYFEKVSLGACAAQTCPRCSFCCSDGSWLHWLLAPDADPDPETTEKHPMAKTAAVNIPRMDYSFKQQSL